MTAGGGLRNKAKTLLRDNYYVIIYYVNANSNDWNGTCQLLARAYGVLSPAYITRFVENESLKNINV